MNPLDFIGWALIIVLGLGIVLQLLELIPAVRIRRRQAREMGRLLRELPDRGWD